MNTSICAGSEQQTTTSMCHTQLILKNDGIASSMSSGDEYEDIDLNERNDYFENDDNAPATGTASSVVSTDNVYTQQTTSTMCSADNHEYTSIIEQRECRPTTE